MQKTIPANDRERYIGDRVQSLAGVKAVRKDVPQKVSSVSRQNPSCTDRTKAALMQSRERVIGFTDGREYLPLSKPTVLVARSEDQ